MSLLQQFTSSDRQTLQKCQKNLSIKTNRRQSTSSVQNRRPSLLTDKFDRQNGY